MHPGGLFYSTATIRQELERIAGGWQERAAEPLWDVGGGWVDPFRDYGIRSTPTKPRCWPRGSRRTRLRTRSSVGQASSSSPSA